MKKLKNYFSGVDGIINALGFITIAGMVAVAIAIIVIYV